MDYRLRKEPDVKLFSDLKISEPFMVEGKRYIKLDEFGAGDEKGKVRLFDGDAEVLVIQENLKS